MNKHILMADLTHTAKGINSSSFPLGIAYVASYAKEKLPEFNIELFKFPKDFSEAISKVDGIIILGLSCYSWNSELAYTISKWAKSIKDNVIVIFGGPNFPIDNKEKIQFFKEHPEIDFYIQGEGEWAFVDLILALDKYKFDVEQFKKDDKIIYNCNYMYNGTLIYGPLVRIDNLDSLISPYLSGILDKFFELPLIPMIETTRGCPFSCSYCSDGIEYKNKIYRFNNKRIKKELEYIAKRVKHSDMLMITDLNFTMYEGDIITAKYIAEIQKKYKWPIHVDGSAGKNKPRRSIQILKILNGSMSLGASIQSADKKVLKNIHRDNISEETYREFIEFGKTFGENPLTYTEVILALPGDTIKTHLKSIKYGVDNGVNNIKMFQSILLTGTDMATEKTRKKYRIKSRFRVIPGCIGEYIFGDIKYRIAEMEEIIIKTKDMSFKDYLKCRTFDLLVEIYFNNGLFEEVFEEFEKNGIKTFDFLLFLFNHMVLIDKDIHLIIDKFLSKTKNDIYKSKNYKKWIYNDSIFKKYMNNEFGINELMVYKGELYLKLPIMRDILIKVTKRLTKNKDFIRKIYNLTEFILGRKVNFHNPELEIVKIIDSKKYRFYHTEEQKKHIYKSLEMFYSNAGGFGRFLQKCNLRKMYRNYEII